MTTSECHRCHEPIPEHARFCARCGGAAASGRRSYLLDAISSFVVLSVVIAVVYLFPSISSALGIRIPGLADHRVDSEDETASVEEHGGEEGGSSGAQGTGTSGAAPVSGASGPSDGRRETTADSGNRAAEAGAGPKVSPEKSRGPEEYLLWAHAAPGGLDKLEPARVSASTEMSNHPASHAFDGTHRTAWNENARGPGRREWIEADFGSPRTVRYIRMGTGYSAVSPKHGDLFPKNAHLAEVEVTFDGGRKLSRKVPSDVREIELRGLSETATRVRFTARAVYEGESWQDLCISEIEIWGGGEDRPVAEPATDPGDAAMAAYRAQIDAYNRKDAETYFSSYAEELECFYNKDDMTRDKLRERRKGLLGKDNQHRWTIDSLEVLSESPDRVVLRDFSTDRWPGKELSDERRMVLVRRADGWKIVVEVGKTAHRCYPEF